MMKSKTTNPEKALLSVGPETFRAKAIITDQSLPHSCEVTYYLALTIKCLSGYNILKDVRRPSPSIGADNGSVPVD